MLTQAGRYVSGEQIFALIEKEEAPKALEQLSIALNVCTAFKETYATYKDTASAGMFLRPFLSPPLPPSLHNFICVIILTHCPDFSPFLLPECPHNPWRIQNSALFARLELFMERVGSLIDFTRTLISFNKLAKVRMRGRKREAEKGR